MSVIIKDMDMPIDCLGCRIILCDRESYLCIGRPKDCPLNELVWCKDCRHLDVWNLKNIYAVCSKHSITFEPFEDDTRTHFCSWGERKGGGSE